MLQQSIEFTTKILNQFIKNKFELNEDIVLANHLVDQNGNSPKENQNKIILSLINIEQDATTQFYNRNQKLTSGDYQNSLPVKNYTIHLLITSNFDNYNESLKFLNASIQFFEINVPIDTTKHANLPTSISKLVFDLQKNEGFLEMQNIWTALGAKYRPSVICKMKILMANADEIAKTTPSIVQTKN